MKKFLKIFFLSMFLMIGSTSLFAEEGGVKVTDKSNAGVASAIANSDGGKTLEEITKDFREVQRKIDATKKGTPFVRLCTARESLLVSGSTIVKSISPIIYVIMVILALLAIKKFFLDNPEQQKNGITSNVVGGSIYVFFVVLLSNFNKLADWWDRTLIPEFNALCNGGVENALQVVILKHLLLFLFIFIQFLGAVIIIMGLIDLVKKDRTGTVNLYGLGTKLLGGVLLVNYKWVLDFFDIIKM